MIKILKSLKYDKTQYDKHFGIFYHMALSKYDKKKKPMSPRDNSTTRSSKSPFNIQLVPNYKYATTYRELKLAI